MAKEGILERLAAGPVVGDGGYLLELEKRGYVQAGPFTPEVSITNPEALLQLHREFLRAGAEVMQALTFYASEEKLATVGLGDKVDEINKAATAIAREAADEGDALVAGNLTLTWSYDPADPGSAVARRENARARLVSDTGMIGSPQPSMPSSVSGSGSRPTSITCRSRWPCRVQRCRRRRTR